MPKIKKLYENHSNATLQNQKYNPILLTTSNVLTEGQIDFVCREIENNREPENRGNKVEILTDSILPEFIIFVFSSKFDLSKEQAIERLKVQEERLMLYGDLNE